MRWTRRTVDLAYATHITVDGKLLLCRSFEVKDGHLFLKVMPECFEIVEAELIDASVKE